MALHEISTASVGVLANFPDPAGGGDRQLRRPECIPCGQQTAQQPDPEKLLMAVQRRLVCHGGADRYRLLLRAGQSAYRR